MRDQLPSLNVLFQRFICSFLLLVAALPGLAGVTVTQNVSPGATSWLGSPIIESVTNPAVQLAVGESFNGGGGCTNYAETFTVATTNYALQTIAIYAGGGTGTGNGTNIILRLFDLGTQSAPNPNLYLPGTDMFNSGNGLPVNYAPQTTGLLKFDFTGSDQVTLANGHLYAFEIDGVLNSSPLVWERTAYATYAGGAAYRNRGWINGNGNQRAFSLAVYATVILNTNTTSTNSPWVPHGIVFHAFTAPGSGGNQDGANPAAGLALSGGVLLGTTLNGGVQGAGTAFTLALATTNFATFHNFTNTPDAGAPQGELLLSDNSILGTALSGGANGVGAVYTGQSDGNVAVLSSFAMVDADTATNASGASPDGSMALSSATLYGTAAAGGLAANGVVFALTTNGATLSVLHQFSLLDSPTGTNVDGALPQGGVILSGGTLFGTTSSGGAGGNGVVFAVGIDGANFTVLHSFSPMDFLTATNVDGATPLGGLVLSGNTLYGTTTTGGLGGCGTVFSLQTDGSDFRVLYSFSTVDSITGTNTDGASPVAALLLSSNRLFGTASAGGADAAGTVFCLATNGTQFYVIHSFAALASNGTNADGAFPVAPLLRVGDRLVGTAFSGGPGAAGTVFSMPIPAPPAVITNVVHHPDGTVMLYFFGGPNSTNVIQSAPSLAPPINWQPISTNVADDAGAWQFTDAGTSSVRFYRSYAK